MKAQVCGQWPANISYMGNQLTCKLCKQVCHSVKHIVHMIECFLPVLSLLDI